METWEQIASRVKKKLSKTHRIVLDRQNKTARFYRTLYFLGKTGQGPLPVAPYEGKEEIFIDGANGKTTIKNVGLGYYKLTGAFENALYDLSMGCLAKEFSDRKEYEWKAH